MRGVVLPLRTTEPCEPSIRAANLALGESGRVFRILDSRSEDMHRGDVFVEGSRESGLTSVPGALVREVSVSMLAPLKRGRVALLWDESYFWGVLAVAGFDRLRFEFELISCADIRCGKLSEYNLLVVPGGWAGEKSNSLGKEGREAVRRFVSAGNSYLGFCGGAGLALDVADGLKLLPVKRMSAKKRIPNFSGSILVRPVSQTHPAWLGMNGLQRLYVWWPSQFEILKEGAIRVLGRYVGPCDDFYVSDLNATDIERNGGDWRDWERRYGTNLNPARLAEEPAIIEGSYGKGRVVASYAHLETPGSPAGAVTLFNVIQYLLSDTGEQGSGPRTVPTRSVCVSPPALLRIRTLMGEMAARSEGLRALGVRMGLWERRNDRFLLWPRGVKGFAFNALFGMVDELTCCALENEPRLRSEVPESRFLRRLDEAAELSKRFFSEATGILTDTRLPIRDLPRKETEDLRRRFSQLGSEGELYRNLQECLGELLYHLLPVSRT